MEAFLRMICRDAIALMELQRKKTLTIEHITYALRRLNKRTIY
jgi:histone H3/H4